MTTDGLPLHLADLETESGTASPRPTPDLPRYAAGEHVGAAPGFEIRRMLGRGGMGETYEAFDLSLERLVALKFLRLGPLVRRTEALRRLQIEARATARVRHPNVVEIHGVQAFRDEVFLVLERLVGETLAQALARPDPLSPRQRLDVAAQIIEGVRQIHAQGVLHRDLKPSNVFLTVDGRVRLIDFGLAWSSGGAEAGDSGAHTVAGSPAYMAPEQYRGQTQTVRTDLWAVGVLFYELFGGCLPFRSESEVTAAGPAPPPTVLPGIPDGVTPLVAQLLEKDPDARPNSADDVAERLAPLVAAVRREQGFPGAAPFRYLSAYGESDENLFFGRRGDVDRLLGLLGQIPHSGCVTVVGPSGAGKTSLVSAGVLPHLKPPIGRRRVEVMAPRHEPGVRLRQALARVLDLTPDVLGGDAESVAAAVVATRTARTDTRGPPALIVVDPFESLLAEGTTANERSDFCHALALLARGAPDVVQFVAPVRQDALAALHEIPGAAELLQMCPFVLPPPGAAALREMLLEPLRALGVSVAPEVADALCAELAREPIPLPLLQVVGGRMWEAYLRRDPRRETPLGGEDLAAVGGLAGVLAVHADEVMARLPGAPEVSAARALICALVGPRGSRRVLPRAELLSRIQAGRVGEAVLAQLVADRLLAEEQEAGESRVTLVSEVLVAGWATLSGWLTEQPAEQRLRNALSDAAYGWRQANRAEGLLWTGSDLERARALAAQSTLGPVENDFLAAALAATGREAERRRRRRNLQTLALVLGLCGMTVLAFLARDRSREAERGHRRARLAEAGLLIDSGHPTEARLALLDLLGSSRDAPDDPVHERRLRSLVWRLRESREWLRRPLSGVLMSAEFSPVPGDARLVVGDYAQQTRVIDLRDGSEIALPGRSAEGPVNAVAFSPDGRLVATAEHDRGIVIWDLDRRVALRELPNFGVSTGGFRWALDGRSLFTFWADGRVIRLPVDTSPEVVLDPEPGHGVAGGARFTRDHTRLFIARTLADGRHQLLEVTADGRCLDDVDAAAWRSRVVPLSARCRSPVPVEEESAVYLTCDDARLRRVGFTVGEPTVVHALEERTISLFSAPGGGVVFADRPGDYRLLRGRSIESFPLGGDRGSTLAALSPDGRLAALEGARGGLVVASADEPRFVEAHQGTVVGLAFDAEGRLFSAAGRRLLRWDPDLVRRSELFESGVPITRLVRRGAGVAIADSDGLMREIERDGHVRGVWPLGRAPYRLAFDPRGRGLAFTAGVVWWSAAGGDRVPRRLQVDLLAPTALAYAPDGSALLVGQGSDRGIAVFAIDPTSGEPRVPPARVIPVPAVSDLRFSPEGDRIAVASLAGEVRVIRWPGGETLEEISTGEGKIFSAAFSPDGQTIALVGRGGYAATWRPGRAAPRRLPAESRTLFEVAWAPDGRRFVAASEDGVVRVFDALAASSPDASAPVPPLGAESPGAVTAERDGARGFADGHLEIAGLAGASSVRGATSAAVRTLVRLPGDLVVAGHADGTLALYDPTGDVPVPARRLNGSVRTLEPASDYLLATTDQGDSVRVSTWALTAPLGDLEQRLRLAANP